MRFFLFFFQVTAWSLVSVVDGWGQLGHEAIAAVAWDWLTDTTQTTLTDLLEAAELPTVHNAHCTSPCPILAYVSDWADTARYAHAFHWSGPLHYIDIHDTELPDECHVNNTDYSSTTTRTALPHKACRFVWQRDCPDDRCVTGALVNYTQQLRGGGDSASDADNNSTAYQAKVALMFVTHFVGDLHQPLHVSRTSDRGGNSIAVRLKDDWIYRARRARGRGFNKDDSKSKKHPLKLHAVWDDTIIDTFLLQQQPPIVVARSNLRQQRQLLWDNRRLLDEAVAHRLASSPEQRTVWLSCQIQQQDENTYDNDRSCFDQWAQESWELARTVAYQHVVRDNNDHETSSEILSGDELSYQYYEQNFPVVLDRLAAAAIRLAYLLEDIAATLNTTTTWVRG